MLADVDSFMKKGSLVKSSRWFSWNQLCHEQLHELHVLKMLLADHFGEDESFSPCSRKDAACIPIRQIHNQAKSFSKAECQSPKAECQMVRDRKMLWVICKSCHRLVVPQIHGKN